jgi:amino-acid N-acetyltransferase
MSSSVKKGEIQLRPAREADRNAIRELLEAADLHTESLESGRTSFYVAEQDGSVVGMAGFEFYTPDALLRSVAVSAALQRHGFGSRVVDRMLAIARERKVRNVVLFTETAQPFFEKKGFRVIDRASVDNDAMKRSSQFTIACPKTAVCMALELKVPPS